ncbi:MAG TPA: acetyl-CoA carboxylase biotin carboxyl carrier protein [Thermoanaerobaculia bacterium]|nr:acetyl-CoA carboxylase biotin carboxyl carrier protein [Thermoanaerobaculia bacterium]
MNFKEILELIDKVAEREIGGVEIEQAGTKIRIEGKPSQPQVITSYVGDLKSHAPMLPSIPVNALPAPSANEAAPAERALPAAVPDNSHILTSPIVGTFYRSPGPEQPSFVEVGSRVKKGQVLCIIEAMKLMNEIESDIDGVIQKIFPSNAQAVEFGEPLFAILPD